MKNSYLLLFIFIIGHQMVCGQIVDNARLVDWHHAGFERGNDLPSLDGVEIYNLEPATGISETDYDNITSAIDQAKLYHQANPNKYFVIQFQSGTYRIADQIKLSVNDHYLSYTVFRGTGCAGGPDAVNNPTTIIYEVNETNETNYIFEVTGSNNWFIGNIIDYDPSSNKITLDTSPGLSAGRFVDIQFSNGSWADYNRSNEDNYFGQVTKIKSISGNEIILEDDFSVAWQYKQTTNNCKISVFNPIENVGFENFTIRFSENILDHQEGSLIRFLAANNSWVQKIEGYKPIRSHIGIDRSYAIQVSRSYFQQAHSYGGGGYGYGVAIGGRSAYCKVEDNIFRSLRHAMQASGAASRNVFGYNYSREQYNDGVIVLSDLNLHGLHPYANLFEGNRVDRIRADAYWGPNGIYNTFLRNYTYDNSLQLDSTSKTNVVGNEAEIIIDNSFDIIDLYAYSGTIEHDKSTIISNVFLPITSYYLNSIPDFIETEEENGITWPPIGPSVDGSSITAQNNPARLRYCTKYPSVCGGSRIQSRTVSEDNTVEEENTVVEENGTGANSGISIKVYPNPSSSGNHINVTLDQLVSNKTLSTKLYNTDGQLVYTEDFQINNDGKQTFTLNKAELNRGLFILVIDTGDGKEFRKKVLIK